jgi:hypothetical protein
MTTCSLEFKGVRTRRTYWEDMSERLKGLDQRLQILILVLAPRRKKRFFAERCAVTPDKLPKYIILIRCGPFHLELGGRTQIFVALASIGAVLGFRLLSLKGFF